MKQLFFLILTLLALPSAKATSELSHNEEAEIQQAIDAYEERPWDLGIAAGYGLRTNPLVNSDDIPIYAVLNIAYYYQPFFFDNGDIGLTLHETDKLSVNLIAHVNDERGIFELLNDSRLGVQFFGSESSVSSLSPSPDNENDTQSESDSSLGTTFIEDSQNLQNQLAIKIPKRSFAVDAGLELLYADDWGDLQLQVLSDISFTHKGFEVWASYAYPWRHGNWKLVPSIGVNWKNSRLLDYYYGVRDKEANLVRSAYTAESGFNSFAKLSLSYRINDNWGIVGVAEYETLSRSIRRSPIVNEQSINTFFIGLIYNF